MKNNKIFIISLLALLLLSIYAFPFTAKSVKADKDNNIPDAPLDKKPPPPGKEVPPPPLPDTNPTDYPTMTIPTIPPTDNPTDYPTDYPTMTIPTIPPTDNPTDYPTDYPTVTVPTIIVPTEYPTENPTENPTYPTEYPTDIPTAIPPTNIPTVPTPPFTVPPTDSSTPTSTVTSAPTITVTSAPTITVTSAPTTTVTSAPTTTVTGSPTTTTTPACLDESYHNTASSTVGQAMKFNSGNLKITNASWTVVWTVDGKEVYRDDNISGTSYYTDENGTEGIHEVVAAAVHGCNKVKWTWTWTVTKGAPASVPAGSGGSSGGGGSGGGGGMGVTSGEPFSNILKHQTLEKDLKAQQLITYEFNEKDPDFSIYRVEVADMVNEAEVSLRLERLKNVSALVSRYPAGIIYSNENLLLGTRRISLVNIYYKVPNSWISQNGLSTEDIKLLKFNNGWKKINNQFVSSDGTFSYYKAITNSLGFFVVSGLKNATQEVKTTKPAQTIIVQQTVQAVQTVQVEQTAEKNKNLSGNGILAILWIIISVAIFKQKMKKKN